MAESNVTQALESSRRELLDLSARNRLISMPIESKSARLIHAIDEDADTIYRLLVDEGKALSFVGTRSESDDARGTPLADLGVDAIDGEPDRSSLARDTRLTTALTPDGLQKRLLTLSRDAQSIMEEQGVHILFLAIGRLTWYEANQSETPRHAPLLLVPVDLRRTSARARFTLRWREEDIESNLSLAAKLRTDFGIDLPPLTIDEHFRPSLYADAVRSAVASAARWQVDPNAITLGLFSFAKFLMYRDLDPRNWPEPARLLESPALNGLLGGGFGAADRPFPEDLDIDRAIPAERLDHVVDADGSQTIAIETVRSGRSLVIQGPPGTGKSQTITNILATAALDGKRVLFVAEKLAALEVVKRRLETIGLGALCLELHSSKANKKAVLGELDRTWQLGRPKAGELEAIVQRLDSLRGRLNTHAASMHTRLEPSGETFFRILGALATIAGRSDRTTTVALPDAPRWAPEEVRERRERIADLARRAEAMGGPAAHAWRGVTRPQLSAIDQPALRTLLDELHAALAALRPELESAAESLGQRVPNDLATADLLRRMAAHVADAPTVDREAIRHGVWSAGLDGLKSLVDHGRAFAELRGRLASRVTEAAFNGDLRAARAAIAAHGASLFRFLRGEYRAAMAALRGCLRGEVPRPLAERVALLDEIIAAQGHRAAIRAADATGRQAFGHAWRGDDSDWGQLGAVVGWVGRETDARLGPDFRAAFTRLDAGRDFAALSARLNARVTAAIEALRALGAWAMIDAKAAFGVDSLERVPLVELGARLDAWRSRPEAITEWNAWFVRAKEARERGIAPLVDALEAGKTSGADAADGFELAYFGALYGDAIRRFPDLGRFDGIEHTRIVEDFRRVDRERLTLAKYRVLAKHYDAMPDRHGGLGMTGVLLGEFERKRGHRPIRKLLKDAGAVAQAIKPIFMMSPLSVAQFLEPGAIEFDLLVIDEASQIPPVDAFGAFVRAGQHVVVGDSKQLPPTRFFARLTGNDEEEFDEDAAPASGGAAVASAQAKDMESILGLCGARGVPDAMLRWHYRSRHQSLIAVSNHEFYDDRLAIVPSPAREAPGLGLAFRYLPNARYDRGGSGTNQAEAEAVCAAVLEHVRTTPERTLGVAAFSIRQQQAILDQIERARRDSPELEEFHRRHEHEPFFVKNLESVQGDERDVIFISVGYGPDASGYLTMNFGPLSGEGGERRLNVLITRAKRRCVVFSSIRAADIDLARATGRGVAAFKSFLQYAETGILGVATRSDREEGSPFETAVRAALEATGLSVDTQVGVSGFFIDLAVIDPAAPGRYLLGIECDGAAYHSSRSARDRDRLRQAVLEDHGWTIHRIWSTDWFQRPKDELAKVLAAVERAKAKVSSAESSPPPPAAPVPERPIQREADDVATESVTSISVPYVEARCDHTLPGELIEVAPAKMAEVVALVLRCESPIHVDELIARVRSFWGLERSGARIQEAILRGIRVLVDANRCVEDGEFLIVPGVPVPVRDRSEVASTSLRRIDAIAPIELKAAVRAIVEALHGASEADLGLAVARSIGFKTTSAQVRERVGEVIRDLIDAGELKREGGLVRGAARGPGPGERG